MTKSQELTQTCSNSDSVALLWQQGVRSSLSHDFFKRIEKWCLFYIQVDPPIQGEQIEVDWEKLLHSYFDDPDVLFIGVAYEQWVVMQPDRVSDQRDRMVERSELLSKARGLLEKVRSEIGGEARIIVGETIGSSEMLFEEMDRMKRAEKMSYKIDPDQAIVTTWNTFLYELIHSLQVHQLDQVCAVIPTTPLWSDAEMMKTIQCFLEEDLNVSETARKLYIHRNTLLYRLEKIREEIGYDLRVFDDAMMVKLMQFILRRKADVAR